MSYKLIEPPFELDIREMPKKELRRYFAWFMDVMSERIRILAEAVNNTPGFESWQPDFAPGSLDQLGEWFAGQVETRERTAKGIRKIKAGVNFPIDVSETRFTIRTLSLIMDVGMYLGQVMARNYPTLKWVQPLGSKRFVDYGKPSLAGFEYDTMNPVYMVHIMAYGLVSKKATVHRLLEIHDIWSKKVGPNS